MNKAEPLWGSKNRQKLPVQALIAERGLEQLQMKLKLKDAWGSGKRVGALEFNFLNDFKNILI